MRDAAAAAAMSDPTLNRWFNRRWIELPADAAPKSVSDPLPNDDELETSGLALLHEWRRLRGISQVSL